MIRKIKDFIWKILISLGIGGPIQLILNGALIEDGWYKSYNTKRSVDKNGNPIPWCTYPFIKFIEPRLKKNFRIFEFGAGNSTLWYAEHVEWIRAVEHDKEWINYLSTSILHNVEIIHKELSEGGDYSKEVMRGGEKYDIIIIDGRDRNNCVKNSIDYLTDKGIIIFDNSNLPIYRSSIDFLSNHGFKKIDFIGMSPVTSHNNCTSIFYKTNNCLAI
jgi:hypothetical protein